MVCLKHAARSPQLQRGGEAFRSEKEVGTGARNTVGQRDQCAGVEREKEVTVKVQPRINVRRSKRKRGEPHSVHGGNGRLSSRIRKEKKSVKWGVSNSPKGGRRKKEERRPWGGKIRSKGLCTGSRAQPANKRTKRGENEVCWKEGEGVSGKGQMAKWGSKGRVFPDREFQNSREEGGRINPWR